MNRRLRDEDPDVSSRLDLEAKLQQSKAETAQLAEHLKLLEWQLAEELTAATTQSGEQQIADTHRQLQEATE